MHTNKMALVPFDAYTSLGAKQAEVQEPITAKLANVNSQLISILDDPSLPDDIKLQHYEQLFSRYRHLKENKKPLEMTITTDQSMPSRVSEVIDVMPKSVKTNAKVLLQHLQENPTKIKFDTYGRLLYEGKPVDGSNYVDLLLDTSRHTKQKPVTGSKEFLSLLKQTNAPNISIGNPNRSMDLMFTSHPNWKKPLIPIPTVHGDDSGESDNYFSPPSSPKAPRPPRGVGPSSKRPRLDTPPRRSGRTKTGPTIAKGVRGQKGKGNNKIRICYWDCLKK